MYIVRPVLRSASPARPLARPPARLINRRRFPLPTRTFHSSRRLTQASNPPPSPSTDDVPVKEDGVDPSNTDKKDRSTATSNTPNAAASSEDANTATTTTTSSSSSENLNPDDPELLAQKLQRSKELTRRYSSALRRQQRKSRATDLPPIYIPDWFLSRRVRIPEQDGIQLHSGSNTSQSPGFVLTVRETQSGERASCTIPYKAYSTSWRALEELVRRVGGEGVSEEHRKAVAREMARKLGREGEERVLGVLEAGRDVESAEAEEGQGEEKAEKEKKKRRRNVAKVQRVSPLVWAEIRATVAAALATVQPAVDSFPATKTNLILHTPSNGEEAVLQNVVMGLAEEFDADVVTLDAQDLAQLAGDYLGEGPEPTPHSIRSLGYETYKYGTDFAHEIEDLATDETLLSAVEEDIQNGMGGGLPGGMGEVSENPAFRVISFGGKMSPKRAIARLAEVISNGQVAPGPLSNIVGSGVASAGIQTGRTQTQSEIQLEDLKLSTLLEALVDANELKRSREPTKKSTVGTIKELTSGPSSGAASKKPKFFEFSISDEGTELDFSAALTDVQREHSSLEVRIRDSQPHTALPDRPKIIYIRDIKELNGTAYGSRIIQKLEDIVRKQRNAGQSVMILGTTSSLDLTPELTATAVRELQADGQAGFARTIVVPVLGESHDNFFAEARMTDASSIAKNALMQQSLSETEKIKFLRVNLRHIEDMMRNLDPEASRNVQQMQVKPFLSMFSEQYRWRVLTYDEVHRISLTAFGLHQLEPSHGLLNWAHVALAMSLLNVSDDMKFAYMKLKGYPAMKETSLRDKYREHLNKANTSSTSSKKLNVLKQLFFNPTTDTYTTTKPDNDTSPSKPSPEELKHQKKLRQIANTCNKYEKRLLQGIVNPDQIKTTFDQIHVPQDTLDAIRTLTSLSLIRPDAFNYGVLATEKVSGALLYGPPGTGKTLLAKAVAKESGSGVLEVSGSQIADKYVGEGEKNVTAIFSLARKMAPCVVFLDEADSILGSRSAGRERTSHREILNQFLKEWDGLSDTSVFVMVATNRPFDMDDAVIRRLPRRLLVDLPTEEDRKKILEIHLRGEKVGEGVDLGALAKKMPFYSGSDIKNVVVFAALACVREENERAVKMANDNANSESETETETKKNDPPSSLHLDPSKSYTFPPHRTLQPHHFEKAIQEVSASISDDMSSLKLIRKFDEQFGDRRGRKKKVGWGFGEVGAGGGGEEGRVRVG